MKCPNGCRDPAGSVVERAERVPLDEPEFRETPNGIVEITTRQQRFLECRICGWRADI